jgi:hypothetical protein
MNQVGLVISSKATIYKKNKISSSYKNNLVF